MSLELILSALALSVSPVALQQGNLGPTPSASSKADNTIVCKQRLRTGTRFKAKTCRTRAQWDAIAEASRQNMKDIVDRPQVDISREAPH